MGSRPRVDVVFIKKSGRGVLSRCSQQVCEMMDSVDNMPSLKFARPISSHTTRGLAWSRLSELPLPRYILDQAQSCLPSLCCGKPILHIQLKMHCCCYPLRLENRPFSRHRRHTAIVAVMQQLYCCFSFCCVSAPNVVRERVFRCRSAPVICAALLASSTVRK